MSRVTDTYGPIPYSKIGQDGKITIPYDTQEEVYNAFFKELDESIEVLTENRNAALVASADFVYSGNVTEVGEICQLIEVASSYPHCQCKSCQSQRDG